MGRSVLVSFGQLGALIPLLLGLSGSGLLSAHQLHSHPAGPNGEIHSHELGVAITCASPPYYYLNGDGGGREWELIAAAFRQAGHPARALYLPLTSASAALRQGWLDAVWVCGGTELEMQNTGHWSEPLLPRQFAAVTLAGAEIPLRTVADLAGKTVGIHPETLAVLGDTAGQLEQMTPPAQRIGNYGLLLLKLYTGRIDVLVIEKATFEYFRRRLPSAVNPEEPVVFHEIFPTFYPRLVFRDLMLRDEFDAAWLAGHGDINDTQRPTTHSERHASDAKYSSATD